MIFPSRYQARVSKLSLSKTLQDSGTPGAGLDTPD